MYTIRIVLVVIIEILIAILFLILNKNSILKKYLRLVIIYAGLEVLGVILRFNFWGKIFATAYIWGYGLMRVSIVFLGIAVYMLPTVIAFNKKHNNKIGILLLNIFLGWSLIGWAGALIWACIKTNKTNANVATSNKYEDLERLQKLRESGVITQEEFDKEKSKLLK